MNNLSAFASRFQHPHIPAKVTASYRAFVLKRVVRVELKVFVSVCGFPVDPRPYQTLSLCVSIANQNVAKTGFKLPYNYFIRNTI